MIFKYTHLVVKSRRFRFANQVSSEGEANPAQNQVDFLSIPPSSSFQRILEKQAARPSAFSGKNKREKKRESRQSSLRRNRWLKEIERRERESNQNGSKTRTVVIDAVRDVEVVLTPSVLSTIEEMIQLLRKKVSLTHFFAQSI